MTAPFVGAVVVNAVAKFIDRVFPDPLEAAKAKVELINAEREGMFRNDENMLKSDELQNRVNVEEAKSDSLLSKGWRPGAGWVCTAGLAYEFLLRPLLAWLSENWLKWSPPPALETETLLTLLFGLLGLGYYRTRERLAGRIK